MEAIQLIHDLNSTGRPASPEGQRVLARWSSWGAIPEVFDDLKPEWDAQRAELRELLSDDEWDAAARTTINAHYTDPMIARQVWRLLDGLGFRGGAVLEPGSGAGTFIGLAPESAQMTGVELDPLTAAICAELYPHATVCAESFADTQLPEGHFDAAIGNVPFSSVTLHDPLHNATRQSMHNHFIIKSLRLTRPGGLVAVLTSHFTMDAQNPGARREMNELADLVGAIRLPTGAHRRAAGTEVVTDLLVFRRRPDGEQMRDDTWETVAQVPIDGVPMRINRYFDEHPEQMLGEVGVGHGMYDASTLTITTDLAELENDLAVAVDQLVFSARRAGLTMTERTAEQQARRVAFTPSAPELWDGSIVASESGDFHTVVSGSLEPLAVPRSAARELRALLRLRDSASHLLTAEAASVDDTADIVLTRATLRRDYLKYVGTYGALNRYTLRPTGRTNEDGEETFARIVPTAIRLLRADPFGPLVLALEQFDDEDQSASPAAIMSHRVVVPRAEVQGVDSPADAIAVSLDRTGRIDLPLIADLLGMNDHDARAALGTLVFTDPATDQLVHAPEYLSGDVRVKLEAARQRAEQDPAFQLNVDALAEVLPAPLGIQDIHAKLGAVWISADVHEQFLRSILRAQDVRVENPLPGMWEIRGGRQGLPSTSEWGTPRRPAPDIAQAVMEQRTMLVYDEEKDIDGKVRRVLNPVETAAAQEKADALQERFSEWVWEDPTRAQALVDEYNRRFNSIVLRDYTDAGAYLSLPGLAATFEPRTHQRAAVARMVSEPAAGLFHEVGAGKTAEMIMGAMEMRRMGLIGKPVVVVPNHMLEQFGREWLQIYPRARVLAASSLDLTADKRRLFVARAAANEWDAIILTQGAFAKIPLRAETQAQYIRGQVEDVRRVLDDATGEQRMSVKRIQRKLLAMENKLKDRLDSDRDRGVCFEDIGIDYVIVDEMHMYKNLATESNIRDAAIEGSDRASDLHMKLEYLRSAGRERVVTAATATPISNSITETYVMQRYLRPDVLEAAGVGAFDAWAATFGELVTQMEISPTGTTFRMKTRFARFQNGQELLRMWSVFADVKTADDLDLPVPALVQRDDSNRAPSTVPVRPTVELEQYVASLAERAEKVATRQVRPDQDNMLLIATDGRKAALDIRMVISRDPSGPSKVDVAADAIHRIWERTRGNEYLDTVTGQPSAVRGALQLVFSDIGTPSADRWNAYDELRQQLVKRGIPAEQVRYMHDAKSDVEKARLFAAARAGHVAVLIGSTEKMGVGTNVQARAIALHHLDCPWRPSDIAQRDGRIMRQGNQNEEVAIVRYVTERSFDSYMWQTVERKAASFAQLLRGKINAREIEEIDTSALSAAEAKAIASGNPLLLEHSVILNEVNRLRRLQRAQERNEDMLIHTGNRARSSAERAAADIHGLEAAMPRMTDTSGDRFRITLGTRDYDSRSEAAHALAAWTGDSGLKWLPRYGHRDFGIIGRISGFDIHVEARSGLAALDVTVSLPEVPRSGFTMSKESFLEAGLGLVQRIENRVSGIPTLLDQARADLEEAEQTVADTQQRLGQPFRHAQALADAEEDLTRVETQLAAMQDEPRPEPAAHEPERVELTIETVRAYEPNLGSREGAVTVTAEPFDSRDPTRQPPSSTPSL